MTSGQLPPAPLSAEDDTSKIITLNRPSPLGPPVGGYRPPPAALSADGARSRWIIPIVMIAAGVIAAAVFGALSLMKASDELAGVEAERDRLAVERDQAVARAAAADEEADELASKLMVAERAASKAKKAVAKTNQKADELEQRLRSLASETSSEVERDGERLTFKLVDKVLFRSGESELTKGGKAYLRKLGAALKKADDKLIWVQGHTDNVPVAKSNSRFPSNWELSAARALSVVHFLQKEVGIDGRRLAAVAFSKYRPVSRRNKAKNRRIEILLAPRHIALD